MKRITTFSILILLAICVVYASASGLYQEEIRPISGQVVTYKRVSDFRGKNTYNQIPSIEFLTESITVWPDGEYITKPVRKVGLSLSDPNIQIPLLDPATGETIGMITGGYMYSVLYSAWREAERLGGFNSTPSVLCYSTNGIEVICP